jgi:hypothetical protein
MKTLKFVVEETVPVEDWFKGGYEAHQVKDLENCYCIIKIEDENGKGTTGVS